MYSILLSIDSLLVPLLRVENTSSWQSGSLTLSSWHKVSKSYMTNNYNKSLVLSCPHPRGYVTEAKYNKIRGPASFISFLGSILFLP